MRALASHVAITAAPAGAGKTYSRCACFVPFYAIPNGLLHISNFPVNFEALERFCERRRICRAADVRRRVLVIPSDELKAWEAGRSGPWVYLSVGRPARGRWIGDDHPHLLTADGSAVNLGRFHVALDEAHRFVGSLGSASAMELQAQRLNLREWQAFVGEVRHRHGRIEFLTQDESKLHSTIVREAGSIIRLVNADSIRDPAFGILLSDWFELLTALTGEVQNFVIETEYVKTGRRVSKKDANTTRWKMRPELFALYDSFSAPLGERQNTVDVRRRVDIVRAFVRNNWMMVGSRVAFVACLAAFVFGGGVQWLIVEGTQKVVAATVATPPKVNDGQATASAAAGQTAAKPAPRGVYPGAHLPARPEPVAPDLATRSSKFAFSSPTSTTTRTLSFAGGTSFSLAAANLSRFRPSETSGTLGAHDPEGGIYTMGDGRSSTTLASSSSSSRDSRARSDALRAPSGGAGGSGVPLGGQKSFRPAQPAAGVVSSAIVSTSESLSTGGPDPPPAKPPVKPKSAALSWTGYE